MRALAQEGLPCATDDTFLIRSELPLDSVPFGSLDLWTCLLPCNGADSSDAPDTHRRALLYQLVETSYTTISYDIF